MNIFTQGEKFSEIIKISINSLKQFRTVSCCSCLMKNVTQDSLMINANHHF